MNKDTRDLLSLLVASPTGRHTLATVVGVAGSSYRRPGARLLAHASGVVVGSVSGGCLDGEIARRGAWWAESGPVVRRFDGARDDDAPAHEPSVGTGCGGTVDVLIENASTADAEGPFAALHWIAARRAPACLVTAIGATTEIPAGARCVVGRDDAWTGGAPGRALLAACRADALRVLASGKSARRPHALGGDALDVFLEHVAAPRELLVAGRHHDVAPLVRMARAVGWEVTSAASGVSSRALGEPDHRIDATPTAVAGWSAARRGAAVVVMTHDAALDRDLLAATLAKSLPGFVGVLGPAHRTRDLVRGLELDPPALAAVRTPVGLDLGGDGPEAIALSIVADLQAWWHDRTAVRLCPPGSGAWCDPPRLADAS